MVMSWCVHYCSVWSPGTSTFLPMSRDDDVCVAVGREDRKRGECSKVAEGGLATRGDRFENDWSWDNRVTPTVLALTLLMLPAESSRIIITRGSSRMFIY